MNAPGGKRHVALGVLTWPHTLVRLLPFGLALQLLALWVLQMRGELPKRGLWGTLGQAWRPGIGPRGLHRPLEPGDITFEYPPQSGLVWEVTHVNGAYRAFKRDTTSA